ncbi:glycosyltransferase [bacterium]|nr:glycosyltransferase [bacterium]
MSEFLFWFCLLGVAYLYAGYPCVIRLLAKLRPLRRLKSPLHSRVSVVIACHNEAGRIVEKLTTLLHSPQAAQIAEILVGSDGSTDRTGHLVRQIGDDRIRVFEFSARRGKPAILNELIPQCQNEIVVLCDARQTLSDQAIPQLLANFADERVGVVSGELMFQREATTSTARRGIGAYWHYEKLIRKAESHFRGVPGATGALYAIRKSLFRPIPETTLLDDVVIPMLAVSQHALCVFEPQSVAWDQPSQSLSHEAIRKRRTIAGAAQLIVQYPAWLLPWRNPIWFEYLSHKILRLMSPLLLAALAVCNVVLFDQPLYRVLGLLHAGFYVSALVGWVCQRIGRPSLLFGLQLMFVTLNATTVIALWDAFRGRFQVTWQRPGDTDISIPHGHRSQKAASTRQASARQPKATDWPTTPVRPSEL